MTFPTRLHLCVPSFKSTKKVPLIASPRFRSGFWLMAASLTVITTSFLGLPMSSMQCIISAMSGVGMLGGHKNVQWLFLANVCVRWVILFFDATLFPQSHDEMHICLLCMTLPSGFFSLFCGTGFCNGVLPYTLLTQPNHGVCWTSVCIG